MNNTYSINDIVGLFIIGVLAGIYLWNNPSGGETVLLPIATGVFGYMRGRVEGPKTS
jgi:hypothetical protein